MQLLIAYIITCIMAYAVHSSIYDSRFYDSRWCSNNVQYLWFQRGFQSRAQSPVDKRRLRLGTRLYRLWVQVYASRGHPALLHSVSVMPELRFDGRVAIVTGAGGG